MMGRKNNARSGGGMFKSICAIVVAGCITSPASADIIESFQFHGDVTYQWNPYTSLDGYVSGTMIFSGAGADIAPSAVYINTVEGSYTFAPAPDLNFVDGPFSYGSFDISASGQVISAAYQSYDPLPPAGETNFALDITSTFTDFEGANSYDTEYRIAPTDGLAGVQFEVPEPASIATLGCGLLGLFVVRRRLKISARTAHLN